MFAEWRDSKVACGTEQHAAQDFRAPAGQRVGVPPFTQGRSGDGPAGIDSPLPVTRVVKNKREWGEQGSLLSLTMLLHLQLPPLPLSAILSQFSVGETEEARLRWARTVKSGISDKAEAAARIPRGSLDSPACHVGLWVDTPPRPQRSSQPPLRLQLVGSPYSPPHASL